MCKIEDPLRERTLDQDIPGLKEFLRPGMSVLDVGCGEGTITVGVAQAIKPGQVTGIDPDKDNIAMARERISHADNIRFEVGDSHALGFPDSTFDLVYSHTVAHFFLDPVSALREQWRVTRSGGWVVVSGVREMVYSVRFPPCPNWDRTREARRRLNELRLEAFQASGQRPAEYLKQQLENHPTNMCFGDDHAGSKCAGWLADVGLRDLQIQVNAERVQYRGSRFMASSVWDLLPVDDPEAPYERQIAKDTNEMISMGLLDAETVAQAREDAQSWYTDPHAFFFNILIFAAGRVP